MSHQPKVLRLPVQKLGHIRDREEGREEILALGSEICGSVNSIIFDDCVPLLDRNEAGYRIRGTDDEFDIVSVHFRTTVAGFIYVLGVPDVKKHLESRAAQIIL